MSAENLSPHSAAELRLLQIGARLMIMELLDTMRPDWNGYGIKLWAERKAEELDE